MFAVHGEWMILVKNNYVLQWFSGCWNEEAAIDYIQEFREKTEHFKGTQWAIISLFDDWELGVPGMESHLIEHCQRFKDNGCIKDCHIYTPSTWKNMQLESIVPQSEGNYERQVFSEILKAVEWMKECHFNVEIDEFLTNLPTSTYDG
jgi:hypothetical protein